MRDARRFAGPLQTALFAAALAGCSFAPPYHVPDSGVKPAQYQELADWQPAVPKDREARGAWWTRFADPELDRLEQQCGAANQNLKAAFARLQQARADTRIARADLFPSATLSPSAERARVSPNEPRFPPGYPATLNDFVLEADVSYELDLWGRVRNEVAAARATQAASAADLANLDLSLRAELATAYFDLRSADRRQVLLDKTVEDYGAAAKLTGDSFQGGNAALTDVAQSNAQLENARTQAEDIRLQRSQSEHAIAVLVGENPSTFHLDPDPLPLDAAPPGIDVGMPSSLLERRPDIAEAERRVAAANAQIGQARAAYFPQFSLSASAGLNSTHTSNLLSAPSQFWSFGPQISLPLFEGGRLHAQTARAKAAYDEQVADYRNSVLTAYQEVEDNLAALRRLERESVTAAATVNATQTALAQSRYRYDAGVATYLEVATTETTALQAELNAITIQGRRLDASVMLVKALGGGWDGR
jgi:NodT family efflux transporter outer membrane factor (OMF) lipoprotein